MIDASERFQRLAAGLGRDLGRDERPERLDALL
jgi:hypothetical protein